MNRPSALTETHQLARVLRPPTGWPLEPFCLLDEASPGLLRFATTSRPEWRHAVALALANGLLDHADRFLFAAAGEASDESWPSIQAAVAALLPHLTHRQIVEASFGSCPDGLIGALRKLDFEPLTREACLALHAVFADPRQAKRQRVIEQLSHLNEDVLAAACILDAALMSPKLVHRARTGSGAERINRLIAAIRRHCSTANKEALAKSIADLGAETSIEWWARSWLARADQNIPAPPWPGGDGLTPLSTGALLAQASRSTRTCVRIRILQVLEGRAVYYLDPGRELIACVVLTTSGWIGSQVVAKENGFVARRDRDRVFDILEKAGIPCFRPLPEGSLEDDLGHPHFGMDEFILDRHRDHEEID